MLCQAPTVSLLLLQPTSIQDFPDISRRPHVLGCRVLPIFRILGLRRLFPLGIALPYAGGFVLVPLPKFPPFRLSPS